MNFHPSHYTKIANKFYFMIIIDQPMDEVTQYTICYDRFPLFATSPMGDGAHCEIA